MELRLVYEGPLQGQNAKSPHKHQIRLAFHPQLKRLWSQPPLSAWSDLLSYPPKPSKSSVVVQKGSVRFAPLVTTALDLYAELNVLMLRHQPRGDLITDGGDIDNRLKTLLDGLRIPRNPSEMPSGESPDGLFYCLLEDDSLVTKVSVETDQFLSLETSEDVLAIVHVTVKKTRVTYANIGF